VLSEEALIVLGGLGALGLVALGILELLWPARPKHPSRAAVPPEEVLLPAAPPPSPPRRWRSNRPRHAKDGTRSSYRRREDKEPAPAFETEPVSAAPPREIAVVPPGLSASESAVVGSSVVAVEPETDVTGAVDRCFSLYQQRAYPEAVGTATAAIAASAPAGRAAEVARLWSIVALAHQAMEDRASARVALESAIRTAPDAERPAYERQLATLASHVAQLLVAQAEGVRGPSSEGDLGLLREALDWLARGAAAAPADSGLRELASDVERRLWPAYERVVMALVQRQEYRAARALLREALDDPRFPGARAETFRELFSGTYGGEIGQLTAQAIRSMQDARETEALAALERAEELLATIHDEALPPKRREEVDRRLWWGYKKLGRRRAQAGEHEAAAEALFHALRFAGVGTDRQAETRAALVRALEGLVEKRALAIRELAESGDREAAVVQSDRLWTRLRGAVAEGLTEEDLAVAFAKAQRVLTEVGVRP
jgi:tetratricopeptide (TPR) repeat protein